VTEGKNWYSISKVVCPEFQFPYFPHCREAFGSLTESISGIEHWLLYPNDGIYSEHVCSFWYASYLKNGRYAISYMYIYTHMQDLCNFVATILFVYVITYPPF